MGVLGALVRLPAVWKAGAGYSYALKSELRWFCGFAVFFALALLAGATAGTILLVDAVGPLVTTLIIAGTCLTAAAICYGVMRLKRRRRKLSAWMAVLALVKGR